MEKQNRMVRTWVIYAMIAAIYTVTSLALAPISFGSVQFRISEALTLLPVLMPEAVIGVTVGCALTNIIGAMLGVNILGFVDVIVGTLATFLAALGTQKLARMRWKNIPVMAAIPPIVINAVFIGAELAILLGNGFQWPIFWIQALSVGIGQLVSCCLLGLPLVMHLEKRKKTT